MNASTDSEKKTPCCGGNKKLFVFIGIGIVCLLAALGGRYYLNKTFDVSNFDTSPTPRQGLNAPFITTPDLLVERMVELAELSEDDLVYDLGCGDGRLVITASLKSGCRGVGFDIDPERVAESQENAKLNGVEDRVTFEEQDVFTVDLSEADCAIMYLLGWMMDKLLPQFQEMKPGSRIIAHDFWIHGVEPDQYIEIYDEDEQHFHGIYVYTLPLKLNPSLEKGKPPRPQKIQPTEEATP